MTSSSRFHIICLNGTTTTLRLKRVLQDVGAPRSIALRNLLYPLRLKGNNGGIDVALVRCCQVNKALSGTFDGTDSDFLGAVPIDPKEGLFGRDDARWAPLPPMPEYRTLSRGDVEELEVSMVGLDGTLVDASGVVLTLETRGC